MFDFPIKITRANIAGSVSGESFKVIIPYKGSDISIPIEGELTPGNIASSIDTYMEKDAKERGEQSPIRKVVEFGKSIVTDEPEAKEDLLDNIKAFIINSPDLPGQLADMVSGASHRRDYITIGIGSTSITIARS